MCAEAFKRIEYLGKYFNMIDFFFIPLNFHLQSRRLFFFKNSVFLRNFLCV